MAVGENIKNNRVKNRLTQKDLAEKLNVSYQTVSKWENETNEPDVNTLKQMAVIFNCTIDELVSDHEIEASTPHAKDDEATILPEPAVVAEPNKILMYKCKDCGKELYSGDHIHHIKQANSTGIEETIEICDDCYKNRDAAKRVQGSVKAKAAKRKRVREHSAAVGWSIAAAAAFFIISLVVCIVFRANISVAVIVILPLVSAYIGLATIYCLLSSDWIGELFIDVASWSIKFPGVIFSFSWDGLKFLIFMKILFWILGILLGACAIALAFVLSAICSVFAYPFVLASNK